MLQLVFISTLDLRNPIFFIIKSQSHSQIVNLVFLLFYLLLFYYWPFLIHFILILSPYLVRSVYFSSFDENKKKSTDKNCVCVCVTHSATHWMNVYRVYYIYIIETSFQIRILWSITICSYQRYTIPWYSIHLPCTYSILFNVYLALIDLYTLFIRTYITFIFLFIVWLAFNSTFWFHSISIHLFEQLWRCVSKVDARIWYSNIIWIWTHFTSIIIDSESKIINGITFKWW